MPGGEGEARRKGEEDRVSWVDVIGVGLGVIVDGVMEGAGNR